MQDPRKVNASSPHVEHGIPLTQQNPWTSGPCPWTYPISLEQ